MGVRLEIENRLNGARARIELELPRLVLGRGAGSDVLLPHEAVSPSHCVLRFEPNGATVVDEGSTHGTELAGSRLVVQRSRALRHGDTLGIGPFVVTVTLGIPASTRAAGEERVRVARALVASAEPRSLVVENGPEAGSRHILPAHGSYTLGRDPSCDLVLDDAELSRRHATLTLEPDAATLTDEGSKNGVRVGGRVMPRRALRHGDVIELGAYRVRYEAPVDVVIAAATDAKVDGPLPALPEPAACPEPVAETPPDEPEADPDAVAAEVLDEPAEERAQARPPEPPTRVGGAELADRMVWGLALVVLVGSLLGAAYLFGEAAQ